LFVFFRDVFNEDFFNLNGKRNAEIPCASTDIAIVNKPNFPIVVAANDIKVGTVLCVEKEYVGTTHMSLSLSACFYCHKLNLNLIPCDGCNVALFCNATCKSLCMEDYHEIECKIIDIVFYISQFHPDIITSIRACIKMQKEFKSWSDFSDASRCVGLERVKRSTINEIFNDSNKLSLLNYRDDCPFIHGRMYNVSFYCAVIIHYLIKTNTYFPKNVVECVAAIHSFSRVLMYLILNYPDVKVALTTVALEQRQTTYYHAVNSTILPFIGKLKHSCKPNVVIVNLLNKAALITVDPIESGQELKISIL
jgi:SET and MYND domain-containing protein 4